MDPSESNGKTPTVLNELKDQFRAISQSAIYTALRCKRCFLYRYRWGLAPKIEPFAPSASLGQLFHRLLHLGLEGIEQVRGEVRKWQNSLMDRIAKGEDLMGDLARAAQSLTELFDKALVMAKIFWERFPQPDYLKTKEREITIEEEIGGLKYKIKGILDRYDEDTRDGGLWIRDSKTTSRDINYTLTGTGWGIQGRMYRLLLSLYEPEKTIKGFILDIARVPTIKMCGKDKDFDAYLERVKKWYEEQDVEPMVSKALVFNEPIMCPELEKALQQTIDVIRLPMRPECHERDVTGSYCLHYERQCPYYELCNSDEAAWPSIIDQRFKIIEKPAEKETENEHE